MNQPKLSGSLLAKNTILNFVGQVVPLFVALVTVPYTVHHLGTERFGIFSLASIVLGYLGILDLGLGRATTKFVAEALGKGEIDKISQIVWTSLVFIIILSLVGAITLIVLTPVLVERVLNVPFYLIEETKSVFYITSASFVITLITATLSGVLEAYQRFDLVNTLRIPSNILANVIVVVALFFGATLPVILLLLVVKDVSILFFYFLYCINVMPVKKPVLPVDFKIAPFLFSFGCWIALHNAAVAILLYLDRFLVGVFLNMSAVAYYAVPHALVGRTIIIPSSMMMVLFPAFSSLEAMDKEKLQNLFNRVFKYLILIMGLVIGILFVFSREILLFLLGNDFAEKSTIVLQILAIGILFSSLAWLSGTLLQGVGNARVVTIIHVLQVPIYILSTWLLIKTMNIEGAALSWTARVLLSLVLLLFACWRERLFIPAFLLQNDSLKLAVVISIISGIAMVVKSFIPFSFINFLLFFSVFVIILLIFTWNYALDREDRLLIVRTANGLIFAKQK